MILRIFATACAMVIISLDAVCGTLPCWVLFTDRGPVNVERAVAEKIASSEEPKNRSRRARILGKEAISDERDLPVYAGYCEAVREIAGALRTVTRYFNGVSADLDDNALERVKALPFVKEVRSVRRVRGQPVPPGRGADKPARGENTGEHSYGRSFEQVSMVGAVDLHDLGYRGGGIIIAVLDSGFDNLGHTAFDSLRVSHARDFVDGDDIPGGHDHGTKVLSIMAALDRDAMVGVAPDATYILARTEIVSGEFRAEEDYWVAAVEWADSLGADIVNSSLGYTAFDDDGGYTPEDLDGKTAVTTIAADIAVSRGIVVVTSAGNMGDKPWRYVTTPADGFGVLAVGGVDVNGTIAAFSSRGPTFDGRIKPDFVALGVRVAMVDTGTLSSYTYDDGTSFAAPSVSGAVALILEVNRSWGPDEVRSALIATSSRGITDADTTYGYGLIDALAASGLEKPEPPVAAFRAYDPYPQPLNFSNGDLKAFFPVDIPSEGVVELDIFNSAGENVQTVRATFDNSGEKHDRIEAPSWDGTNFTGDDVAPGIYYYRIRFRNHGQTGKIAVIR